MAKRCRYLTKNEVKGPNGIVWSTVYGCSKEGHPEYMAGGHFHPACMVCDMNEPAADAEPEFQHYRKIDAFDIYQDLGKRTDGYSKVCFQICNFLLEQMDIEPTAKAFESHKIGMIMDHHVVTGEVLTIGINIDGKHISFQDFLKDDEEERK